MRFAEFVTVYFSVFKSIWTPSLPLGALGLEGEGAGWGEGRDVLKSI